LRCIRNRQCYYYYYYRRHQQSALVSDYRTGYFIYSHINFANVCKGEGAWLDTDKSAKRGEGSFLSHFCGYGLWMTPYQTVQYSPLERRIIKCKWFYSTQLNSDREILPHLFICLTTPQYIKHKYAIQHSMTVTVLVCPQFCSRPPVSCPHMMLCQILKTRIGY